MAKTATKTTDNKAPAPITEPADFEKAIEMSGFGLFNYLVLMFACFGIMANVFESTGVSYILSSAECDLKLSLMDKGLLNAITYCGMISSALLWGYVADTTGRKKTLLVGYMLDFVCVLGGTTSQSVLQLMIFKFLGGFVMSGPFAVIMSYLSELHGKKYRPRVMMAVGMMFSIASLLLPLLALTILPNDWTVYIFGLKFRAWQLFLAVCAIPSCVSALLVSFFPESPKFLMSQGRNAEALRIFQRIYAMNHRGISAPYPIKELVHEIPQQEDEHSVATTSTVEANATADCSKVLKNRNAVQRIVLQMRPLFAKPYLSLALQFFFMNFCILLGQNTIRLWLPQLYTSINEYEIVVGGAHSMCEILDYSLNKTALLNTIPIDECKVVITASAYQNNLITGAAGFCTYIFVSIIVNKCDVKRIMNSCILIACCCGIALYFSPSSTATVVLATVYTCCGSVAATSVISSSVSLFPTSLRTTIVSLAMMTGRTGSIVGNIIFPQLIELGCMPPFLLVSSALFVACVISLFLPKSNKTSLK